MSQDERPEEIPPTEAQAEKPRPRPAAPPPDPVMLRNEQHVAGDGHIHIWSEGERRDE